MDLGSTDGVKTVYAQFRDSAADLSPVVSDDILLDTTPPTTGDDADAVWHNSDIALMLTARDAGVGVAATHFAVDGGPTHDGTLVPVLAPGDHSKDGTHTVTYWSVDELGNTEDPAGQCEVKIDTTPPVTTDDATSACCGGPAAGLRRLCCRAARARD